MCCYNEYNEKNKQEKKDENNQHGKVILLNSQD